MDKWRRLVILRQLKDQREFKRLRQIKSEGLAFDRRSLKWMKGNESLNASPPHPQSAPLAATASDSSETQRPVVAIEEHCVTEDGHAVAPDAVTSCQCIDHYRITGIGRSSDGPTQAGSQSRAMYGRGGRRRLRLFSRTNQRTASTSFSAFSRFTTSSRLVV